MKKPKSESDYLVFARKFRPENFDQVIGQDQTTQILRNAIQTGRIPQSFLFAGPRGTGKTSTARVLAKSLNCSQGPTQSPCNQCEICREINRSISLDVLEIDGASNRRIDEIRDLRENVKFKPAQARFKIYIIDEVHMLTDEAFNALLKTLEEPPSHVKFIFATTEPHKVPLTILSRCQRFNFKRISTAAIQEKLAAIAKKEGLEVEANALFQIARASDGSLRDAETLLDQLGALAEEEIREEEVLFALGLAGDEVYLDLLEALRKKEAVKTLSLIQSLYESGKDLVQFGRGLHELFRNLLLLQMGDGAESFIDRGPDFIKRLEAFKSVFSKEELLLILSLLANLQAELRRALAAPKLLIETALFKILHLEGLYEVKELLEQAEGNDKPSLRALGTDSVSAKDEAPTPLASGLRRPSEPPRNDEPGATSSATPFGRRREDAGPSLNDIERVWPKVIESIKAKEMSTGMFLAEAQPIELTDDALVMGLPEEFQFHKEMLDRPEKRKLVENAFNESLGFTPRIQFVTTRVAKTEGASTPASHAKEAPKLPEIVNKAMDIFQGSKIVRAD